MRKPLLAYTTACLITLGLTGCGNQSNDGKVNEDLNALIGKMGQLKDATALIDNAKVGSPGELLKSDKLVYTFGKVQDGVAVPGRLSPAALFIDQYATLRDDANSIIKNGNDQQKKTAQAILATIESGEGTYLIGEAQVGYDNAILKLDRLRSQVSLVQDIMTATRDLSGDRSAIIDTIQTGKVDQNTSVEGINQLQDQADKAAAQAAAARAKLGEITAKINELREKNSEFEQLEQKYENEALSSKGAVHFEKLDKATEAAYEADLAAAEAEIISLDAWIARESAQLAESQVLRLKGSQAAANDTTLMAAIRRILGELNLLNRNVTVDPNEYIERKIQPPPPISIGALHEQIAQSDTSDEQKAVMFLLELSIRTDANNTAVPSAALIFEKVDEYLGTVGALKLQISQIKLEQQQIANQLSALEQARKDQLADLTASFQAFDREMSVLAFDRMAKAQQCLENASDALTAAGLGSSGELEQFGVCLMRARVLQQQALCAGSYESLLQAYAAAGRDVLGGELGAMVQARIDAMKAIQAKVATDARALENDDTCARVVDSVNDKADRSTDQGKAILRQIEVYESLLSAAQNGAPSDIDFDDSAPDNEGISDIRIEVEE